MVYRGINKWTPPRNSGGIPQVSTIFSLSMENEQARLTRDGTAEAVSRDQFLRHERGQGDERPVLFCCNNMQGSADNVPTENLRIPFEFIMKKAVKRTGNFLGIGKFWRTYMIPDVHQRP